MIQSRRKQRHVQQQGFTLLEFLLYISLTAIVSIIAGALTLNILTYKARFNAIIEVNEQAEIAMQKIRLAIEHAQSINAPATSTNASTLSLRMDDPLQNPTIIDLSGNAIRITRGSALPITIITTNTAQVNMLQFSNISYDATPGTIRIEFSIRHANAGVAREYAFEKIFRTTANVFER